MGRLNWYKRDPVKWLHGTRKLTLEERGAYADILDLIYSHDGEIEDDDREISYWLRCDIRRWRRIKELLLTAHKLYKVGGKLRNSRCDIEVDQALGRLDLAAEAGRKSGEKRRKSTPKTNEPSNYPQPQPQPQPIDTSTNVEDAGCVAVDPAKIVYDTGKSLLARYGVANGKAGGLITKWRRSIGDDRLLQVLVDTGRAERHDAVAYIEAAIQQRAPPKFRSRLTDAITETLEFYNANETENR